MKYIYICSFFIAVVMVQFSCTDTATTQQVSDTGFKVKTGAEVLLDRHLPELEGKRVGLLMNPASRVDGTHMLDTLLSLGVNVTTLFAAEHGFRGEAGAGEHISGGVDTATGLPVISLYGKNKKPAPGDLNDVDIVLTDLPDIGVRFYTFSTTMGYMMEAVNEQDKEIWILDRPNPFGGEFISGWMLRDEYRSFVGHYPMPVMYGLTAGEIATMAAGEQWLEVNDELNLEVIRMEGWERDMLWPDTGLDWIAPSPNLPTFEHAFIYPGTAIFEGTNISEGRGTDHPFLTIGAPGMQTDMKRLEEIGEKHNVKLDTLTFTPRSIPGKSVNPKYREQECTGIFISRPDRQDFTDPVALGLDLLMYMKENVPGFEINVFANKLYGIDMADYVYSENGIPGDTLDTATFRMQRKPYLLY